MRFNINDKVKITVPLYGTRVNTGVIIQLDRQRVQYYIDLDNDSGSVWAYDNEVEAAKEFDKKAYAEALIEGYKAPAFLDSCKHKLKLYVGLTEQFNYCETCGEKQDE